MSTYEQGLRVKTIFNPINPNDWLEKPCIIFVLKLYRPTWRFKVCFCVTIQPNITKKNKILAKITKPRSSNNTYIYNSWVKVNWSHGNTILHPTEVDEAHNCYFIHQPWEKRTMSTKNCSHCKYEHLLRTSCFNDQWIDTRNIYFVYIIKILTLIL